MKKLITLVTILMIVTVMAGCSKQKVNEAPKPSQISLEEESEDEAEIVVNELDRCYWGDEIVVFDNYGCLENAEYLISNSFFTDKKENLDKADKCSYYRHFSEDGRLTCVFAVYKITEFDLNETVAKLKDIYHVPTEEKWNTENLTFTVLSTGTHLFEMDTVVYENFYVCQPESSDNATFIFLFLNCSWGLEKTIISSVNFAE